MTKTHASKTSRLRSIPSVDQLLHTQAAEKLRTSVGKQRLTEIAREVTREMRTQISSQASDERSREELLSEATRRLHEFCQLETNAGLHRVINATGVILHTNLGRAPLSERARHAIAQEAAGYCTLEYDPTTGSRGKRAPRAEELLTQLTGAEAALVVNNCAAAALLILTVLARQGETLVSRGELVEIGGDFRVPDVMSNSGTRMVEVGSTNRTRLQDYERAINENTRLIMRVHPSNYRIIGFTSAPVLSELVSLAHQSGLLLYEDAGSGVLNDLKNYGINDEPVISESISSGADLVSFSGDKLLGASQAGLIVGRREIIDRLRRHSLYRALRSDKLCLAALEVTLEAHRRGTLDEIPALRMLGLRKEVIEERARRFVAEITQDPECSAISPEIVPGHSAVGGGCGPNVHPSTSLITLKHNSLGASDVEKKLRLGTPPVIARIADDFLVLDLRTIDPHEEPDLLQALKAL